MNIEHIFYSLTLDNLVIIKQNTVTEKLVLITEFGEDNLNVPDVNKLNCNLKLRYISIDNVCN